MAARLVLVAVIASATGGLAAVAARPSMSLRSAPVVLGAARLVDVDAPSATPSAAWSYTVQAGDTLDGLAQRWGVAPGALIQANALMNPNLLFVGQVLTVPGGAPPHVQPAAAVTPAPPPAPASGVSQLIAQLSYPITVQPGDSLWSVAARHGISLQALQWCNPGVTTLEVGQQLAVPTVTNARVEQELSAAAVAQGVNPALAEAVAWEESGFQPQVQSLAGALGVMQVEPATAAFVNNQLLSPPVSAATEVGNIQIGVRFLRFLVQQAGGNVGLALADYAQGTGSVAANGQYPVTQQYVANVLALQARFGAL